MAYNPTIWANDTVPDIDADNLNKIEQGIAEAHALVATAQNDVDAVTQTVDELVGEHINITSLSGYNTANAWISTNGTWNNLNTKYEFAIIPLPKTGMNLKILPTAGGMSSYAGLKTYTAPVNGGAIDFSDVWTNRIGIALNQQINVKIPDDVNYLLVWVKVDNVVPTLDFSLSIDNNGEIDYLEYDVETLKEKTKDLPTAKKYVAKSADMTGSRRITSTLSVGDTITFVTASYRSIVKVPIEKDSIGIYVNGTKDNSYPRYAVVDASEKILKIANIDSALTNDNVGYYVDISSLTGAAYLYFEINPKTFSVIYYDFNKSVSLIYPGDKQKGTFSIGVKQTYKEKGMNVYSVPFTNSSNVLSITLPSAVTVRTAGIWMKISDYNSLANMPTIRFKLYNGSSVVGANENMSTQVLQFGNWVLIKKNTNESAFDKIELTGNSIPSGKTVYVDIAEDIITDHYARPIGMIDFDHSWEASDSCGAYDYLMNNNVPFTITGNIEAAESKLLEAYQKGLLDSGNYANGHDGTSISDGNTIAQNVENAYGFIEHKIAQGFGQPISFGGGGHWISPTVKRVIDMTGYQIEKGGAVNGLSHGVYDEDSHHVYLGGSVNLAMTLGTEYMYFTHGVSSNPAGETNPSLYDSYDNFKKVVDDMLENLSDGGMILLNMKQYLKHFE